MSRRVYFAQRHDGLIKIGYCKNLRYRIYALRHEMRGAIKILATIGEGLSAENARGLERRLHHHFAEHRVIGEWFSPAKEILAFIAEPIFAQAARQ